MYRVRGQQVEVLLGHPGGPYFRKKDHGSWTIPKGLLDDPDEDELIAAIREFEEETGRSPADLLRADTPLESAVIDVGEIRMKSGKTVRCWAFPGDCDPAELKSNTFELEWPPRSGRTQSFPELDRLEFFGAEEAAEKIHPAQAPLVVRLLEALLE